MQAKGPRIFLEIGGTPGIVGFSNKVMPVEQLRQEVKTLDEIIQNHPRQENVVVHGQSGTRVVKWMPKVLAKYIELEPLFKFAIFVDVNYVLKDLVNPVIRLLKTFLLLIKEIPPDSLELVESLSPVEGITMFLESMDAYMDAYLQNELKDKPWIGNPHLFCIYGEALMHIDLKSARWALEKSLEGFGVDGDSVTVAGEIFYRFRVHANLALVLKELGIDEPVHEK
ncbi:hypothetical protein AX16_001208 [Volvariella volvacea WC 439]|nr:hypothetical protein AX16_001208 [Volvariella volvacea WC 439]